MLKGYSSSVALIAFLLDSKQVIFRLNNNII